MPRKDISKISNSKLVDAALDISENYECPESFENGKCNMKKILGYDCDKNDNHCVAKEVLMELIKNIPT